MTPVGWASVGRKAGCPRKGIIGGEDGCPRNPRRRNGRYRRQHLPTQSRKRCPQELHSTFRHHRGHKQRVIRAVATKRQLPKVTPPEKIKRAARDTARSSSGRGQPHTAKATTPFFATPTKATPLQKATACPTYQIPAPRWSDSDHRDRIRRKTKFRQTRPTITKGPVAKKSGSPGRKKCPARTGRFHSMSLHHG